MIYIITLLVLLFLVFHYDVNGNTRNRMTMYYILMFWYIAVSGFQYCMGSDIIIYMEEYDDTDWSDLILDSFVDLNSRQFGWILLSNLCKLVSTDFLFFKIVQAVFLNTVIFIFLKKNTEAIFTSIFFYSIFLYFDLNFNILRQSIAIGFFLLSISYFNDKKWLKYYIFVLLALMFHSSAIILFILPLFRLLKINKKIIIIVFSSIIFLVLIIRSLPINDFFITYIPVLFKSDFSDLGDIYLTEENYGQNSAKIISFLIMVVLYFWVFYINYKDNLNKSKSDLLFLLIFVLLFVLNSSMPIFTRFNFYFTPFFVFLLSNFIIHFSTIKLPNHKLITLVFFIFLFSFSHVNGLFRINANYNDKQIVQYYPYYSVFEMKQSPERQQYFGSY